jgi:paraquat-inducible protein A
MTACCSRCRTNLSISSAARTRRRAAQVAAFSLAALVLYPVAVSLPIMEIEQFGHGTRTSILGGISALFGNGQLFVGFVVLLCSVIFPLSKLIALLALSLGGLGMAHRHKAMTYRLVEWTGRWGMLDVLLAAVLVAARTLGDMLDVTPGPAAATFTACVVLSLIATARFDPHSLWQEALGTRHQATGNRQ